MSSTQGPVRNTATKVRIFRFLELSWTQIITGELLVDTKEKIIKIIYKNSSNDHLIPSCTPKKIDGKEQKCITIEFSRLSKIEQDQSDRKIVYIWIDVNPFSFSFLKESRATEICQLLQLLEQNIDLSKNQEQNNELGSDFIKNCIETNPTMLSTLFINKKAEIIQILVKTIEMSLEHETSEEIHHEHFLIFQSAIRLGDKCIIQKLISNKCFPTLLKILSWNPFNKIPFNYLKQYNSKVNFNNALDIKDNEVLECYEQNAKVKFLRDVAACMFIEVQNERIFQNIINTNCQTILKYMTQNEKILNKIAETGKNDPITFVNIFVELWDIFKSINVDYQNKQIKEDFVKIFIQKDLHNITLKAISNILNNSQLRDTLNSRFHEKWMEAYNQFLSFNWTYSQEWICSKKDNLCILSVLLGIMSQTQDEGLIQSILNFVKWFTEPIENHTKMQSKFRCYVYNQFVAKVWPIMKQSVSLMEMYTDFIVKLYRVDYIRTRRVIIEQKVLQSFDQQLSKKPMLICVLKIVNAFMQNENKDVFVYLDNHQLFKGLKQQYLRNVASHNMINACFKSLLNRIKTTDDKEVRKYFELIFLSGKKNGAVL